MTGGDARGDAKFMEESPEPKPERLDAEEIEFRAEQPARIVFAEAVGGDERFVFVGQRVGLEIGARFQG